jgi:hypothetical protein
LFFIRPWVYCGKLLYTVGVTVANIEQIVYKT